VQLAWAAALAPLWIALAKLQGLYDRDHRVLRPLTADEIPNLLTWATSCTAITYALLAALAESRASASSAIVSWLSIGILAPLLRAAARHLWRLSTPPERALIIGEGALARSVRRKLELFPDIHVVPVEVDDSSPLAHRLEGVDRVLIATERVDRDLILGLVRECRRGYVKLGFIPPDRGVFGTAARLDHIAELAIVQYNTWEIPRSTLWLKRFFDLLVSAVAVVLLSPLLVGCAVAVVLGSRGSPFFIQKRAGLGGEPFRMLKFRTMVRDADKRLADYIRLEDLEQPMFKLENDPRVTRVGRWLRRTSLDELPQLINVLAGQMSLVGPRPEQLELVERYRPEHRFRVELKPGITGPMQVYGRGQLTFEERLAVERDYLDNLSIRRDFHILFLTFATVARGRGAF
jgi:exopolysaccharide biosynthesis polyprenyl glycosylphosphotransferase